LRPPSSSPPSCPRVAELGAGTGYTTELLARVVGPTGAVYGQSSQTILDRFAQAPWSARLATPPMRNVVRLDRPFDDPFPPDVRDLDPVWNVLFYHDTVWMGVDRAQMNRRIYEALRPGGVCAIVDHSGRPGTGTSESQSLHRIEESVVVQEIEAAGFRLDATSDVLRNPDDLRDWSASPRTAGERRGTSDRFVLRFVKPAAD
jgi:predicted methyltransferase